MNRKTEILNITIFTLLLLAFNHCEKEPVGDTTSCDPVLEDSVAKHPDAGAYQAVIDDYAAQGLPGVVLLIRDKSGLWMGCSGMADIEKDIPVQTCTVSKVASITKLFMGTLVMMLVEEGTINLDKKISHYIDNSLLEHIENAGQATVRQVLNHTSGIYDVVSDTDFYLALLNDPDKLWEQEDLLNYVKNKPAEFETGNGVKYSNTNFIMVSLVIEGATGKDHDQLLKQKIIKPLGLSNTYYYPHDEIKNITAQGYFDLYNNGDIVDMTEFNTGSGNGYGGIYASVRDLQIFAEALLRDSILLNTASLDQMLTFTDAEPETFRRFGLGIFKDFLERDANEYGLGHRGRDLAYSADLFYFPEADVTMAYLVNYGTNGSSGLQDVFFDMRDAIVDEIFDNQ